LYHASAFTIGKTKTPGDLMTGSLLTNKRSRKEFGSREKIIEIPDLIGMQRNSYESFLQRYVPAEDREERGLHAVFQSVFPIKDFTDTASLEYVSYSFGESKHSMKECAARGMTYDIPVNIRVRLVVYDKDKETNISTIRDIKEQEIYFGTIPLMTPRGTFIINGTERAVVSQLHRSSGVFFDHDKGKKYSSGKIIYNARIIPVRGSWIDMEIDIKDIVFIRIDRRRKFPISTLFKSFGYTSEDIIDFFYEKEDIIIKNGTFFKAFLPANLKRQRANFDIKSPKTKKIVVQQGRIFTKRALKQLVEDGLEYIPILDTELIDKAFAQNIITEDGLDIIFRAGDIITEDSFEIMEEKDLKAFSILHVDPASSDAMRKTLVADKTETKEEALMDIYRRLRPGNPATMEVAQDFIDHLFFKQTYYDLSRVGRLKMNHRLGVDTKINVKTLRKEDILLTTATLIKLKDTQGQVDDIDHLGNRRVRAVGELLENHYRIGLVRMERAIKEKMSMQEVDAMMPHDLINPKPVSAVVREFFGTSQLSQFMDQTNPLSETTHKRRLSALGPGGLTRERAGFEVRDVHPSHYGRICPIETPEGPNIGLIVSLCTFASVNDFGFIETPFRLAKGGNASKEIKNLTAFEEGTQPIAQANAPLDVDGNFINPLVSSRVAGEFEMIENSDVKFMDVSPNQLVSVSASLIPFLENDDANRALMGSNMQRQAVPLINSKAPLVGTGMESIVARDSGVTIVSEYDGVIDDVDSKRIVVRNNDVEGEDFEKVVSIYECSKFVRSNQNTCFNHRPIVEKGEKVKKGQVIADGPSTEMGELALGKNVTVAFMPWDGYNYEDSILVSERLVKDAVYTSVHIEEYEVLARDTKLGKEEITRDIPNVGEEALRNLDESGIICLGAEVNPGDILVGKITPKGETQLSPEEKLLRAIFGEKAGDVKDTSLCVPPGVRGKVIDAKVFIRRGLQKDDRTRFIEDDEIERLEKDRDDEIKIISNVAQEKVESILKGNKIIVDLEKTGKVLVKSGTKVKKSLFKDVPVAVLVNVAVKDAVITEKAQVVLESATKQIKKAREHFNRLVSRFEKGDDLPPGVLKMIKISVAMERVLSVGDKMAGRHGNKGVVSRILRVEDLPYFEDGRPVDMVLNPLGVPSRMNVGQILEIHLGHAAFGLGQRIDELLQEMKLDQLRQKVIEIFSITEAQKANQREETMVQKIEKMSDDELVGFASLYKEGVHMATPVFDGASEDEIKKLTGIAGFEEAGQSVLYDGRTGEPFDKKVTVGTMYMLKLHHLVDDKLHARSIGPYSLVTQQPLGGKAQFGGQRLGEMEVWAMEAYGAAHALQEFLTVKSDDMIGRTRMYEKIVKGQSVLEPGMPESFRVLTKELNSLGLDINLLEGNR
jgi:DNA-directed RNA polymerase subunit beta